MSLTPENVELIANLHNILKERQDLEKRLVDTQTKLDTSRDKERSIRSQLAGVGFNETGTSNYTPIIAEPTTRMFPSKKPKKPVFTAKK